MADKLERTYNVPLRSGFIKVPAYKKAKKAVNTMKEFMIKHMKAEEVKIGPELNKKLWKHGIKNPPHHVKVTAVKEDGVVRVELEGVEFKTIKPKGKEEKATGLKGKLESLTKGKEKAEEKAETKKEAKPKAEEKKAETKPVKAEAPKPAAKQEAKPEAKKETAPEAKK
ncbi:60S ribosomal protein L31 [Candidatus Woesearchaeota archaeon]|nr:60S ribosomal protein L31 [Candidatus Woesearchaeota archaeon]